MEFWQLLRDTYTFMMAINAIVLIGVAIDLFRGTRKLVRLHQVEPHSNESLPLVSIVVAARNEARDIEPALQSLLRLDYESAEIVVVNDRSTDATGEILDRLAAQNPRLRPVHISTLPPGWLGKNHALECGAADARGELILFSDADIVFEPTTLRRAVAHLKQHQYDHVAAFMRIDMPGWWLETFVGVFILYFLTFFRPWKVRDPRSAAHVGIGGFNLIRREAYQQIGTHRAIAMRPDDDLKLGKLVKKHGFRSDCVLASELMRVPWYASLREMIGGLEKNAFAGIDYNVGLLVFSSLYALFFHFGPFVAAPLASGWLQASSLVCAVVLLAMTTYSAHLGGLRPVTALAMPVGVLLMVFVQWRTMILNLWLGGIRWRGTFYPLAELKANRV